MCAVVAVVEAALTAVAAAAVIKAIVHASTLR
jgi:hypothetical protein